MGYIGKVPADVLIDPHVDSASIVDSTIVTADIANDAVTSAKLAANSVDSSELIDGSVDNSHLAGSIALNKTLLSAGTGLTLSTNTLNVDAAQSGITSVGTLTGLTIEGDEQALIVKTADSGRVAIALQNSDTGSATNFTDGLLIKLDSDETGHIGMAENKALSLFTNGTTALTLDNSQNATFAGTASFVGMVTSSMSGTGFRTIHASTTTKYTSLAYDGLYTAGAQHQYIQSAQDIKFYPGGTNEVTFADGGLATFAGNITQSKAGNLRHTITATGDGEAALVLTANNTTGDSFVRWETNANTFCMGLDNSDSNKFILSCGSDPHSNSVINIQPDGSSMAVDKPISFNGAITTASTVLISGVSNYTGLEVKGSGGSRPQIKWSNVNNGVMGGIYGTESNGLVIGSGTSNTTAMTISSGQEISIATGVKFEANSGATRAKLHWYHESTTGSYRYYHLKTDISFGTATQMYSLQFTGYSYNTSKAIDTRLGFYNYDNGSVLNIGSTGNHSATVYESSDGKIVLRLDLTAGGAYYSAWTLSSFHTRQGCVDFNITSVIHSNNTNDFA